MFKDQINTLLDQEESLRKEIAESQAKLDSASGKIILIRKARKQLEKLQDQIDEKTTVPIE